MDPITGAIVATAGAQVIAGILGNQAAAKDRNQQRKLLQQAVEQYKNMVPPDPESQKVFFEELQSQGVYTPEIEKLFTQANTELAGVQTDPRLREAQMLALGKLQNLGDTGMDLQDQLDVERAKQQYLQESRNQQANITQNLAQRGIVSPGMEAMQRQMASQSAANQMNDYERQIQAQAQRRALDAILASGQLGGQIRSQEYGEKSEAAKAQDAINRFNTQMQAANESSRVGNLNDAQLRNLAEQQRLADTNVGFRNQAQQANKALEQQKFANEMAIASGKANAQAGVANTYADQAKANAAMYGGVVQGLGQAGSAWAASQSPNKTPPAASNSLTGIPIPTPEEEVAKQSLNKKWWEQ